jgi:hypothetical protein
MAARLVQVLDELNGLRRRATNHDSKRNADFQADVHGCTHVLLKLQSNRLEWKRVPSMF